VSLVTIFCRQYVYSYPTDKATARKIDGRVFRWWFRRNCQSAVKWDPLDRRFRHKADVESTDGSAVSARCAVRKAISNEMQISRPVPRSNDASHPVTKHASPKKISPHQATQHNPRHQDGTAASQAITEKNHTLSQRRPGQRRKKRQVQAYPGAIGFEERERLRRRARGLHQSAQEADGESLVCSCDVCVDMR
jgi:hypothetical protein